jgi:hypothetical protein
MDMEAKANENAHNSGNSPDLNMDEQSHFALMFANVRKDLGETLVDEDPRVWIVSIKKAAGARLF